MGEGVVSLAGKHPAQQAPLPLPEPERLARGPSDGVLGDRDKVLGEVGNDVAQTVTKISRGDGRQPAWRPPFASSLSRYLSILDWLSTIAIPSFARSAGVNPSWFIHFRIESSAEALIPTAGCA